ncbi:coiled-coil domain-containing protein 14 isoform X4 [Phyllopteryx taeniolatus]|uniref:coiled-coil domain-containing protein 14 isoform X4 n=1 Tax=Phyllopteryx taeniolatus TaxID=161469 RepID=UPI002AD50BA7|nr:coiled-coil domain-containing protein 14 isoform X4 [Phyllopteryx taeniolatus]
MKGSVKRKVLTSGRLPGGGAKVQQARKRATFPGRKEPAFSLYSTEPQDQVASLHSGLDRCAVLLSGMLQADKAEPVTHPPKAVNGGTDKSKSSTGPGKKTSKKFPPMTEKSSNQVPRAKCHPPVSQSGVKEGHTLRQSHLLPSLRASQPLHGSAPSQPLTSVLLSVTQSESVLHATHPSSQRTRGQTDCQSVGGYQRASFNGEDVDSVPVKDTDIQSDIRLSVHANDKVDHGQLCDTYHDTHSGEDIRAGKLRTIEYLLGELKTLIAGKGSIAERLLSHLEITVSSPQMNSNDFDAEKLADLQALHIQNAQLHRRVAFLNKQLKDKEGQHNTETLCTSEVLSLPEDLADAQSRLQEIQVILAEVRKSLLDTKKQIIKSGDVSECDTVVDLAMSDAALKEQYDQSSASERITKYLMTLDQPEASHIGGNVHMAAEREENTPDEAKMSSTLLGKPYLHLERTHSDGFEGLRLSEQQMAEEGHRLFDSLLSEGKVDAMSTDCSMRSVSTFDTRDEVAFRDGLAALDASIASLQKTIKQDLGR